MLCWLKTSIQTHKTIHVLKQGHKTTVLWPKFYTDLLLFSSCFRHTTCPREMKQSNPKTNGERNGQKVKMIVRYGNFCQGILWHSCYSWKVVLHTNRHLLLTYLKLNILIYVVRFRTLHYKLFKRKAEFISFCVQC